ncbi:hypothetical protein H5410_028439 [Solanum commersonii]|uniref:Transposase MuDR plant domain-containing protein n=1 Tax=Solanum commersonii TaxID=4109 RepID=A0A9J5Z1Y8_SOLCO|nr:hypothetical protein H5410_028439 [Solanum commersonii]
MLAIRIKNHVRRYKTRPATAKVRIELSDFNPSTNSEYQFKQIIYCCQGDEYKTFDNRLRYIYNIVYKIPNSREVEIFVEHTEEDQWNYDVADSEGNPLQGGEDLIDVNVTEKSDESDATCEECESFNDPDYSLEEYDMIFDKIVDSIVEWVGLNGRNKENQVKEKTMEVGVASNMLAMFPNDTQENDCATSDEELMSLHVDSDNENLKRSTVFNPTRDLEDPKFKFTLNMIFSNSKEFKWAVEKESARSRAICKVSSCKWFICASKSNQDEPFKIKTIDPDHSCGKQRDNKTIDSGFLAKKYIEEFRTNPSWGVNQLNQPRVPNEKLRSSAFILEEIGEHSREVTRPLFIKRMGT